MKLIDFALLLLVAAMLRAAVRLKRKTARSGCGGCCQGCPHRCNEGGKYR